MSNALRAHHAPVRGERGTINMSETKIKIPEGMLEAAAMELSDVGFRSDVIAYDVKRMLKAALRWLSENPIVPTDAQIEEMKIKLVPVHPHWSNIVAEWQRRMFLAPEPEAPMTCRSCNASTRDFKPYPCCGHCGAMLLRDAVPESAASAGECAGADVECKERQRQIAEVKEERFVFCFHPSTMTLTTHTVRQVMSFGKRNTRLGNAFSPASKPPWQT